MPDDLGFEVAAPKRAHRIVSLVPSLTEAIASVDRMALVGVTDWCTHPEGLDSTRVRGTKNPDCALIESLAPDVVIANKEENRQIDVDRLRAAGLPVWVTDIESVDQAITSMRRMFTEGLGWPEPRWLDEAEVAWSAPAMTSPPGASGLRVAVAIWRDPWMVVGGRTFTGDILTRLGCVNAFADHPDRYPRVELDDLDSAGLDLVLLPDEPYVFTASDGPEAFAKTSTALVSGRLLTWYGPSMVTARQVLSETIRSSL